MLAGFRSRWMMPCSCAASRALADLPADAHRLVERNRSLGDAIRQRRSLDELQDERGFPIGVFQPVNGGDVGMVQRGEELRFALEAGQPIGIAGEEVGQDLERDVAPEPRVAGAKHLAHAPGAELADDLVRAQFRAGSQGHVVGGNSTGSWFTVQGSGFRGSRGSRGSGRLNGGGTLTVKRITVIVPACPPTSTSRNSATAPASPRGRCTTTSSRGCCLAPAPPDRAPATRRITSTGSGSSAFCRTNTCPWPRSTAGCEG